MVLLYKGDIERGREWRALFARHAADIEVRLWPDVGDPNEIRYLLAWMPPEDIAERFPALEAVFATSAGVDQFDITRLPAKLPLVRMLDPGIEQGMREYASFATLYLHRLIPFYQRQQTQRRWSPQRLVPAARRRVGIMGLGRLGASVAEQLRGLGFSVRGWSRSPRELEGVHCYAGEQALPEFLADTDILICLLPLTDATRGILDARLFRALPEGAALINMGRGAHLVEDDLIEALDSGRLSGAVLDVLNEEPPPDDHPFWAREEILLTPHIAAMTLPDSAFPVLLDNLRRHQRGEPMRGTVDRGSGY
ncbi:2-hydroxyacid dehydrogenase [Halotalea alkalilenta]|uniref:2-hydroxyacid dehydrogenase n=1 Tax=Halotalea alkalilenta TaxID=376489 RepID=UPI00047F700C|nr:glyoxylate/hydroxypyruvate reductase A [Halotalea alkalilenta]